MPKRRGPKGKKQNTLAVAISDEMEARILAEIERHKQFGSTANKSDLVRWAIGTAEWDKMPIKY